MLFIWLPYLSSLGLSVCLSIHLYLSIYVATVFLTRPLDQTWFFGAGLRGLLENHLKILRPCSVWLSRLYGSTWLYLVIPGWSRHFDPLKANWRRTEAVPSNRCHVASAFRIPRRPARLVSSPRWSRWEPDGNQHPPDLVGAPGFPKHRQTIWKIASLW